MINNDFDFFEQLPLVIEINIDDYSNIISEIRQEFFLCGENNMNFKQIIQKILMIGSISLLNEMKISREISAYF